MCNVGAMVVTPHVPEVRLVDEVGEVSNMGLVQVRASGAFASVCGLNQGAADAICKGMGYHGGSIFSQPCSSFHGKNLCGSRGTPVAMQNLRCKGSADKLSDCEWETSDISCLDHSKDSIVQCHQDPGMDLQEGSFRLIDREGNPRVDGIGRLQVLFRGDWTSVCKEGFTIGTGSVACKTMGFPALRRIKSLATLDGELSPGLEITCNGSEESVLHCSQRLGECSDDVLLQCGGQSAPIKLAYDAQSAPAPVLASKIELNCLACCRVATSSRRKVTGYVFL